ncbi:hypothetical protein [uncultured Deinococcus sp.]|uniref:hypothetical protein n=1 Tax=uncultured Deinococcus sp. TaxID=158789 RepID=UPI00258A0390|nr:hypothetical protein [uncultured Deinococcus sp.]
MPKTLTNPTPTWTDTLTVPRDGENVDAGDVNGPFKDLLGNTRFLYGVISDLQQQVEILKKERGGLTLVLPAALALEPGRSYVLTDAVAIGRINGYQGNVDLAALDLPAGVTATFSPDPAPGDRSTLTLDVGVGTVAGPYNLTVTGTGPDGKTARALLPVTIAGQTQKASFAFSTAQTGSIDRGRDQTSNTFIMRVERAGQFDSPITFAVDTLPAGLSAEWSQNPVTGSASLENLASVLTLKAAASLPAGTYNLTLRASGGGVVRTQGIALTVTTAAAAGQPDFTLETVYDQGDVLVTNGATVYINRAGGYGGPVTLSVPPSDTGPVILVNGQPWSAQITGNTARVVADGASRGWTNSGVAPMPGTFSGSARNVFVRGTAILNGTTVTRTGDLIYRYGNRTYGDTPQQKDVYNPVM